MRNFFDKQFFVQSAQRGGNFIHELTEKDTSGTMNLAVMMKNQNLRANLKPQKLYFLCHKRCADHVIWEKRSENTYRLHIFELKRTVTAKKWEHIKDQFQGAFFSCMCVAAIRGWRIDPTIKLYTVYHVDGFDTVEAVENDNTDTVFDIVEPDLSPKTKEAKTEWSSNVCRFLYPLHLGVLSFLHQKIDLPDLVNGIPTREWELS